MLDREDGPIKKYRAICDACGKKTRYFEYDWCAEEMAPNWLETEDEYGDNFELKHYCPKCKVTKTKSDEVEPPITVYLSDDCLKREKSLTDDIVRFPETGLNEKQIKDFVRTLEKKPVSFITASIYLMREIELSKLDVVWDNDGRVGKTCYDIGDIEVLDREISQSMRYLKEA